MRGREEGRRVREGGWEEGEEEGRDEEEAKRRRRRAELRMRPTSVHQTL